MLEAILLTINISLIGVMMSYFFGLKMYLEQRIASGAMLGIIALCYISFVIAHFWGLSNGTLALTLILINSLVLLIIRKNILKLFQADWQEMSDRYRSKSWQFFGVCLLLFICTFGYLVSELLTYKDGTFYVQPVHAYGDISLHLGIISNFVYGNNFPPQNPNFSGSPISYPFMVDYLTALFIKPVGLTYETSMAYTGVLLFSLVIVLLAFFVIDLSKSKKVALLALVLFLFNGGFGFIYIWETYLNSGRNFFEFLLTLPQDYTAMKDLGYWWINVNLSMLLPQRSFLFGFGVALLILTIFLSLKNNFQIKSYILVIIMLALLPLIHTHSMVALAPFVLYFLFFIFKNQNQDRVVMFLIGLNGLIAAFLLSRQFLVQSDNLFSLFSWQIGWMSHDESALRFYIKNFGAILFILPVALYFLRKDSVLYQLGAVSLIWFLLPSLMIFQPWDFDNIKLFIYWYFFASVLSAAFLVKFLTKGWLQKGVMVVVVGLMIFAGGLDVFRILVSAGTRYPIYGPEAIELAEFIKENTSSDAVFISADKFDNPAVSLAGRKVVMGFGPWLWTYGLNYAPREQLVKDILSGSISQQEIKKFHISHVIFFPNVPYTQNQQYFDDHYQLIYNQNGYRIYKL
jgi:hypothetical protein